MMVNPTQDWEQEFYPIAANEFRSAWRGAVRGPLRRELQQCLISQADKDQASVTMEWQKTLLDIAGIVLPLQRSDLERLQELTKGNPKSGSNVSPGRTGTHHIDLLRRFLIVTALTPKNPGRVLAVSSLAQFILQTEEASQGNNLATLLHTDRAYIASLARLVSRQEEIPTADRDRLRKWANRLSASLRHP